MEKYSWLSLVLFFFVTACAADAQDLQKAGGNYFVQTAGGVPRICGMQFTDVYSDNIYKQGGLSAVSGSIAWMSGRGNFVLMVKVNGVDFPGAAKLDMTPIHFRPTLAQLAIAGSNPLAAIPSQCEDANAYCAGYGLPTSVQMFAALNQRKLELVYNRELNGLDLRVPIQPDYDDPKFSAEIGAFKQCMLAITSGLTTGSN